MRTEPYPSTSGVSLAKVTDSTWGSLPVDEWILADRRAIKHGFPKRVAWQISRNGCLDLYVAIRAQVTGMYRTWK